MGEMKRAECVRSGAKRFLGNKCQPELKVIPISRPDPT